MTNTDEDDDDTNAKTEHQLLSPLGPLFERFSAGTPRARPLIALSLFFEGFLLSPSGPPKNKEIIIVQKVDTF